MESKPMMGIKGRFVTQLLDENEKIIFDSGEQDNLILDSYFGFDRPIPLMLYLCIGTGVVTPPAVTDTNLGNQVASSYINLNGGSLTTPQQDGYLLKKSGTTDLTGFTGVVSELGLRQGSASGTLITRSLIKDAQGNPTTITVSEGQTLRITYSLYMYVPYVIDSGVISSPHGDLHWNYGYLPSERGGANQQYTSLMQTYWGLGNGYTHFRMNVGNSSRGVNAQVISDWAGKVNSAVMNFPAATTGGVLGGTGEGKFIYNGNYVSYLPLFFLSEPRPVLPPNYDFSITLEVRWGRLP